MAPFNFRGLHEWFFNVILTSVNSIPIQSLWVAFFTSPRSLNRALDAGLYENGFSYFSLIPGAGVNTAQSGMGALFANAVRIPGDGINVSKIGPDGSGMIKGNIGSGRKDMENLSISFLDTNQSFTDYNLRPWTIYAGHKSLKDPSVKTTITVIQLAKTGSGNLLSPRAIWTFNGAVPINIATEEWNYGNDNVISRTVDFSYNFYTLNANPLDAVSTVASVVNQFKNGNQAKLPGSKTPTSNAGKGLGSYGKPVNVSVPIDDNTRMDAHSPAQLINVSQDDMIANTVGVGLDILTGGGKFAGTNVTIKTDDTVTDLINRGQEFLKMVKILPDDAANHNATEQVGFVGVQPADDDHETRNSIGNVKELQSELSRGTGEGYRPIDTNDTPLFTPGPRDTVADSQPKKITGNTVGGEMDAAVGLTIPTQTISIKNNDTIKGKNIISNIVSIPRNNNIKFNVEEVNIKRNATVDNKFEVVTIKRNDTASGKIPLQIVNINKEK